ncbi:MAG: PKD domain-containing protein [Bacteroidales bacterium]
MKLRLLHIVPILCLPAFAAGQDHYSVKKQTRISTAMNEAGAVAYDDGVVYITESTSVGAASPQDRQGRRLFTIFHYKEKGGGKGPFVTALVTPRHEGPVSFTGDFQTMVFSQQRPSSANRDSDPLGLYFADRDGELWTNIRPFEHNDPFAWFFSPSISEDGNTLFFAGRFDNDSAGFDIFMSEFSNGRWSKPERLGPAVNTLKNEIYPCIHPSGKLFFSSEGRGDRRNGFDLFESARIDGEWTQAVRLESPFNSRRDDYHIQFSRDFKSGYLTSNRAGGSKDIFTFGTDIPSFDSPQPIKKTFYKYRIWDSKLDSVDPGLFRYSWTINDTLELPGHEVIYRFPKPGTYICRLNIYDLQLDSLLEPQTFKTLSIKLNEQGVITSPDTVRVGEPVDFSARETNLPGFNIGRYLWEFGDGHFGEGIEVEHTFLYPGTYKVVLGVQERQLDRKTEPETRENFKNVLVLPSGKRE